MEGLSKNSIKMRQEYFKENHYLDKGIFNFLANYHFALRKAIKRFLSEHGRSNEDCKNYFNTLASNIGEKYHFELYNTLTASLAQVFGDYIIVYEDETAEKRPGFVIQEKMLIDFFYEMICCFENNLQNYKPETDLGVLQQSFISSQEPIMYKFMHLVEADIKKQEKFIKEELKKNITNRLVTHFESLFKKDGIYEKYRKLAKDELYKKTNSNIKKLNLNIDWNNDNLDCVEKKIKDAKKRIQKDVERFIFKQAVYNVFKNDYYDSLIGKGGRLADYKKYLEDKKNDFMKNNPNIDWDNDDLDDIKKKMNEEKIEITKNIEEFLIKTIIMNKDKFFSGYCDVLLKENFSKHREVLLPTDIENIKNYSSLDQLNINWKNDSFNVINDKITKEKIKIKNYITSFIVKKIKLQKELENEQKEEEKKRKMEEEQKKEEEKKRQMEEEQKKKEEAEQKNFITNLKDKSRKQEESKKYSNWLKKMSKIDINNDINNINIEKMDITEEDRLINYSNWFEKKDEINDIDATDPVIKEADKLINEVGKEESACLEVRKAIKLQKEQETKQKEEEKKRQMEEERKKEEERKELEKQAKIKQWYNENGCKKINKDVKIGSKAQNKTKNRGNNV